MNQSLNEFKQEFIDLQIEMLWRQWSALGVSANVPSEQKRVLDPEALLAYTLSVGPRDKRLFHAAIEWLDKNGDWLSISRLKTALSLFCRPDDPAGEGIISAEALSLFKEVIEHQGPRWRSIVNLVNEQIKSETSSAPPMNLRPRGVLGPINFRQPALAVLQLRAFFGIEARADVFVFLLFNEDGNSNSVAKDIFADQGNVYKILEKWAGAGIVAKTSANRIATYSLANKTKWLNLLGLDKKLIFLNWMHALHVLGKISTTLNRQPWATDSYLTSSLFRDVLSDLTPLAKQLKIDLPEPTLHPGAEFYEPLSRTLIRLVSNLID